MKSVAYVGEALATFIGAALHQWVGWWAVTLLIGLWYLRAWAAFERECERGAWDTWEEE